MDIQRAHPALMASVSVELDGVPETSLWPLWNRAHETNRRDSLLRDPWSRQLVDVLDYDFARHFGKPNVFHPIRARWADDLVRAYCEKAGDQARVIALGEGLDSSRLRTNCSPEAWLSVDLPEVLQLRRTLFPEGDREQHREGSALDERWMRDLQFDHPPFISALGLLMYFREEEVRGLLTKIRERLPGAELVFDTIPPFFSRKTLKGLSVTDTYQAPPMPWGISVTDTVEFLASLGWRPLQVQTYADPFPHRTRLHWMLGKVRPIRSALAGGLIHARCP